MEMVLPMNTGAEAVETRDQGRPQVGLRGQGRARTRQAIIVVCDGNFHGRTTTIVSFSTDPDARDDFGPYTPGFRVVPYGDRALPLRGRDRRRDGRRARRADPGRGRRDRAAAPASWPGPGGCAPQHGIADDRATRSSPGSAAPGTTFACEHEDVVAGHLPARQGARRRHRAGLRGGVRPPRCSACPAPGQHGSTFGGNPLACAVGREVVAMLRTGEYQERAAELGAAPARPAGRRCRRAVVSRCAGAGCGPGVEIAVARPAARSASGSRPAGCWPRTPTAA